MIFLELLKPHGIDYRVYWESAWLFVHGLNPYHGIISTSFPLNYPPPIFFFIWPLGLLRYTQAAPLWNIGSTLAVIISIYLVLKIASLVKKIHPLSLMALVIMFSFLFTVPFFPVKFNIGNGQINHFILLFSVLGLYFYETGRKNFSAFFLAFASAIKLAPLIFLLYFIIRKDWRQVIRVLLFFAAFYLLPFMFFSWDFQKRYYLEIFWYSFTLGSKDWYYNQSLFGFLARSIHNPILIQAAFYGLSVLLLCLTYIKGIKISKLRAMAAVSSLYLIIHPIALQHYFGFALIPLILLAVEVERKQDDKHSAPWYKNWLPLIISYLLISWNIKRSDLIPREFNVLLSHQFWGILIVWLLALWRDKFWLIVSILWTTLIIAAYTAQLLCRAKICF